MPETSWIFCVLFKQNLGSAAISVILIKHTKLLPSASTTILTKSNHQIIRSQLPVTPAEVMTIHKSQGQTYNKVIIDLNKFGKFRNRALFYVAFSRVKKLSNLYLIGKFNPILRTKSDDILQNEITHLKTNKKVSLSFVKYILESEIIIIYHNVRSLTKNIKYIINDTWYHQQM